MIEGPKRASLEWQHSSLLLYLLISVLITLPTHLLAAPELIDDQFTHEQQLVFEEVQGNILSPYCPGRLLKDCPSSAARDLKLNIKKQILTGKTSEEILHALLDEYGEEMRAAPKAQGIGLLAWVVPGLFLILGLGIILLWIIQQTKKPRD
ncbi:MAG: cytochrome c-type biogenesis protein [Bdellovibrionota bacterium]|jgi:cytochrome c-type biogenesis protein CcmH/NrfF